MQSDCRRVCQIHGQRFEMHTPYAPRLFRSQRYVLKCECNEDPEAANHKRKVESRQDGVRLVAHVFLRSNVLQDAQVQRIQRSRSIVVQGKGSPEGEGVEIARLDVHVFLEGGSKTGKGRAGRQGRLGWSEVERDGLTHAWMDDQREKRETHNEREARIHKKRKHTPGEDRLRRQDRQATAALGAVKEVFAIPVHYTSAYSTPFQQSSPIFREMPDSQTFLPNICVSVS